MVMYSISCGFMFSVYVIPLVRCAMSCWLHCIISMRGFHEDPAQNGATSKSISSLPTYKFEPKKNKNLSKNDNNSSSGEGGVIAAGIEKEHVISGGDAVNFKSLNYTSSGFLNDKKYGKWLTRSKCVVVIPFV